MGSGLYPSAWDSCFDFGLGCYISESDILLCRDRGNDLERSSPGVEDFCEHNCRRDACPMDRRYCLCSIGFGRGDGAEAVADVDNPWLLDLEAAIENIDGL
jgi:hypothetical protein